MRDQPDHTATRTTTIRRAPCPTCGGSGFHPSTDETTPCNPCQGTGIVPSASEAHAIAHLHAENVARLLQLGAELEIWNGAGAGALRYAAEHLTVQAAMTVDSTPAGVSGAPQAADKLAESMMRASNEFAALHAVLIDIDGATAVNAMAGAALIARATADRLDRAEADLAKLRGEALRAGEDGPE